MENTVQIKHYLDFTEDRRISMEVYASGLFQGLCELNPPDLSVTQFRPHTTIGSRSDDLWRMRFERYVCYPRQVKIQSADLHHVLDHGYAHLVRSLQKGIRICTVHDIIPYLRWTRRIPSESKPRKPVLNIYSLNKLKYFDHIVADSESTRRDLIEHLDLPVERISVIPPGVSATFAPNPGVSIHAEESSDSNSLKPSKSILISGSAFYKNHATAVEAFALVMKQVDFPVRLLRSGQACSGFEELVKAHGLTDSVDSVFVSDHKAMCELYNSVDCLLFPSLYEGFGMPVIEALACGTPVVTSNVASLPEVAGDVAIMHSPQDAAGMARSMIDVLTKPEIVEKFRARGPEWAGGFLWANTASRTLDLYKRLIGRQ